MIEVLNDIYSDYTIRTVTLGTLILGIVSGSLGTFAVLRRQSLLGDAISHAALPGIVLAFLITGSRAPLVLVIGAAVSGWLATIIVMALINNSRIKADSGLALTLSVFFGFGMVLITMAQRRPDAAEAGLERFLFGQAAALVAADIRAMAILGGVALVTLLLFWKECKILVFDRSFASTLGFSVRIIDILLTSLLVIAIVIGLQTVGVVLMSAMLVAPAAAARQWSDRLGVVTAIAGGFGALAGTVGALISAYTTNLPTGPTIVMCLTVLVLFSLLAAPNRGLAWKSIRQHRQSKAVRAQVVLSDMYSLAKQHDEWNHAHSAQTLTTMSAGRVAVDHGLEDLERDGLVQHVNDDDWALTERGYQEAQRRATTGEDEQ